MPDALNSRRSLSCRGLSPAAVSLRPRRSHRRLVAFSSSRRMSVVSLQPSHLHYRLCTARLVPRSPHRHIAGSGHHRLNSEPALAFSRLPSVPPVFGVFACSLRPCLSTGADRRLLSAMAWYARMVSHTQSARVSSLCFLAAALPALVLILVSLLPRPRADSLSSLSFPCPTATPASPLPLLPPVLSAAGDRACSATDNAALIDNMVKHGLISSPAVAAAMKQVDRCYYVTRADASHAASSQSSFHRTAAYLDSPQYIGYGATISAPHMHAMCAELMLPALRRKNEDGKEQEVRVLDVGSGSGYLLAVMSRLLQEKGRVFGIEHIPELVNVSRRNIQADDPKLMERISITQGDGRLGLPSAAPFDAIHVGAAAAEVPAALLSQLREGGLLIIPVGEDGGNQTLELIEKGKDGQLKRRTVTGVCYVPLTSAEAQRSRG